MERLADAIGYANLLRILQVLLRKKAACHVQLSRVDEYVDGSIAFVPFAYGSDAYFKYGGLYVGVRCVVLLSCPW